MTMVALPRTQGAMCGWSLYRVPSDVALVVLVAVDPVVPNPSYA